MTAAVARTRAVSDAYGLHCPDLIEARAAVDRVCGPQADRIWAEVTARAGLDPADRGEAALRRVIEAMSQLGDPVVALCARALTIRLTSFEHLSATQDIVRSSP